MDSALNIASHFVLWRLPIDATDAAMRRLLALRLRLVAPVRRLKLRHGIALLDPARERAMHRRAARHATRLGLGIDQAAALLNLSLEACRAPTNRAAARSQESDVSVTHVPRTTALRDLLLALIPPPRRWAPWTARLPHPWVQQISQPLIQQALATALAKRDLDPIQGRTLAIEVSDLGWRTVIRVLGERIEVLPPAQEAEASVRGSMTDLLLLASRIEDADTLFFQRRLQLTGDVELGLCARNLLDRLSWESLPLALRIPLNRAARFTQAARDAHRRRWPVKKTTAASAAPEPEVQSALAPTAVDRHD